MTMTERVWVVMGLIAVAIIAIAYGVANQAQVDELNHVLSTTTSTTSTTVSEPDPTLRQRIDLLEGRLVELEAKPGLTGPEVRALVESLLPEPNNPPEDGNVCAEPPCSTTTTITRMPPIELPTPPTTQKRRSRH